jgi:hypothetical protein
METHVGVMGKPDCPTVLANLDFGLGLAACDQFV